jgi:hypothetical protein
MATVSERAAKCAKELFMDKYFRETALASNNHDDHAHAEEIAAAVIEQALLAERRLAKLEGAEIADRVGRGESGGDYPTARTIAIAIRAAAEKEVAK